MSVAIRTAVRLQDQDDVNVTLGVGVDEYALCWDNDTAKFVLRAVAAGVTDHGALTGRTDDDHTGYALLAGRAGGQTLYGGTAANDDITIHGTSNATRTTSYVIIQPTGGNVGIGTTAPGSLLQITGSNIPYRGQLSIEASDVAQLTFYNGPTVQTNLSAQMYWDVSAKRLVIQTFENGTVGNNLILQPSAGRLGIGQTAPATLLHGLLTSAATNAVTNVVTIGHDTSGTAAAGFGAGQLFQLESSTTAAQSAARIQVLWYEATHATRKADLVLTAYDTSEREGLRIRGNGSAAEIGFLGATPAAGIAHVADPAGGGTVDAEARTAINSILATLETFGFHHPS